MLEEAMTHPEDRIPGKAAWVLFQRALACEAKNRSRDVFQSIQKGTPYNPETGPIQEEA
jgi:hypothetical protein